jgi:hypothetical protein
MSVSLHLMLLQMQMNRKLFCTKKGAVEIEDEDDFTDGDN